MLIYLRGIIYAIIPRIGKFFARPVSGQFGFTGARVVASGKNKKTAGTNRFIPAAHPHPSRFWEIISGRWRGKF
jgi:hypothetical protein